MYKYSINVIWSEEDGCYIATIPEFSGLSAFGDTQGEAIQEALVALEGFVEVYKEDNIPLPKAKTHIPHSGQTRLRLPKSLHAALAEEAKLEGVSLNTYIINVLAKRYEQNKSAGILEKIGEIQDSVFALCQATLPAYAEPESVTLPFIENFQSERNSSSSVGLYNFGFNQNICIKESWQNQIK